MTKTMQWEYTEVLSQGSSGEWVFIPNQVAPLSVAFSTYDEDGVEQAGEGYVEVTLSTDEDISDGKAVPIKWPAGDVSVLTTSIINSCGAVRLGRVSGTVRIDIRTTGA